MKKVGRRVSGLLMASSLVTALGCSRHASDLGASLQSIVSSQLGAAVKNCVLSVAKGDGSFTWSGAAGVATGQVPMTRETPIYAASITKLYTATVVMRLCEDGALSLDDPMAKYLPSTVVKGIHVYMGKDLSNQITIRQLLSHSSGIGDYYDQKGRDGKSLFEILLENPDSRWTVDQTIERARNDLHPNFAPGEGTSYSDTNFQLLGKVVEAVTGKSLAQSYDEVIFRPLGLRHTYLLGYGGEPSEAPADVFLKKENITRVRSNGSYWADGGIVSTAEEMIIFLRALNEGKIISKNTLSLMHEWRRWRFPLEYGLGTMYFSFPQPMRSLLRMPPLWGHSGSTGSFLYYCEDADLYLAGTLDQVDAPVAPFFFMYKAMAAVRAGQVARNSM
jgi:D-alanyl-D-alanine carboxypeptidase